MSVAIGIAGRQPGYVMEPACSTGWIGVLDPDKALVGRVSTPELCALIVGLLNAPDMVGEPAEFGKNRTLTVQASRPRLTVAC
ncbi:hypothetical protein I5K78_32020 [Pseudomonas aeruginosa]|nr:hypothetical protein [Pseudomonas aeruginosa]